MEASNEKKYNLYGTEYTVEELWEGYGVITQLDDEDIEESRSEMTDDELYEYMLDALYEDEDKEFYDSAIKALHENND